MNISITLVITLIIISAAGPLLGYWLGWELRGRTEARYKAEGSAP